MATEINIQELTEDDIAATDLPEKFNGNFGNLVQELISHIDNKENPHTVTAEQLGLTNAYVYKGSVATYQDLLAIQNPENGWVYDVQQEDKELEIAAGSNFAWNGTSWDNLGGKLSGLVKTVNGEEPDSNGNIQIETGDAFQKDMGYRENSETVKAGDIRFLYGKENAGKILMYTQDGVTAGEEPEFPYEENLNYIFPEYKDLNYAPLGLPIPNPLPYTPDGFVPALGQESTVETYPVFKYIQQRHPEMVIAEEQWQRLYTEQNGHVPYYSSGNGSTTFRFPCLLHYFNATTDGQKIGKYEADGLPNITASPFMGEQNYNHLPEPTGALYKANAGNTFGGSMDTDNDYYIFDASRSNPIYGASDTVRPKTAYGTWIIKAYGATPTKEEMEAAGLVQSVGNVEVKQHEQEEKIENILSKISNMQGKDKPTLKLLAGNLDTTSALLKNINFSESWRNFDMIIIVSKSAPSNGYTSVDWMWVWEIELAIESAVATGTDSVRRWSFPLRFAGFWFDFYGNNVTDTYWQLAGQDSALPKAIYGARWE